MDLAIGNVSALLDGGVTVIAGTDAFGLGDRGRLVEGARADLIVVDGDPVADLSVLSSPAEVWVAGVSPNRSAG